MKKGLSFFAACLVFVFSSPLVAQNFHSTITLLGQGRENANNQKEFPLNGYLHWGAVSPKETFSFENDIRFFRDVRRSLDDVDLYQARLRAKPNEAVQISFGRQFLSEGFSAETIDGAKLNFRPENFWLESTLYSGVFRNVEIGDFNTQDGLLTGISLELAGISNFQGGVRASWRKNNITLVNLRENDEILAGGNFSCAVWKKFPALFYGLAEYNTTAKMLDTGTLGLDWTLSRRASINLEGNYFNINRQTNRNTILSLFALGPTFGGRFASTFTLIPNRLDVIQSYVYQRIEIQQDIFRNGHIADTSLLFSFPSLNLSVRPGYRFAKSFGGRVHGGKIFLHEDFSKKLNADISFDYVSYRKITSDNDTGLSTVVWGGYQFWKGWTLSGGMEYNKNNIFKNDVRGSFKLGWSYEKT